MIAIPGDPGPLHLTPLPEQLRQIRPPVSDDVLAVVEAEYERWRNLHDRLIAMIAALIDVAASDGRSVLAVIEGVIAGTTVPLDTLVGARIETADIAGLLRAHGSTGSISGTGETTTFRHECGSGLRYWRGNPDTPKVGEGEVPGVPAGRPRYCARCIYTINGHGSKNWAVTPPGDPNQPCTWTVTTPEGAEKLGAPTARETGRPDSSSVPDGEDDSQVPARSATIGASDSASES